VRLRALKSDPSVFGATYEDKTKMADGEWQTILKNQDEAIFGIFNGAALIGLTAISIHRDDPEKKQALLWGSWLELEYRGRGVSKMMYEARLDWAQRHPTCEKIIVGHRDSNLASKFANQKYGFVYTSTEKARRWPDGKVEDLHNYELIIKP